MQNSHKSHIAAQKHIDLWKHQYKSEKLTLWKSSLLKFNVKRGFEGAIVIYTRLKPWQKKTSYKNKNKLKYKIKYNKIKVKYQSKIIIDYGDIYDT